VASFLTTYQVFVDIRFAVGNPDPPHAFRRTPHALTCLGPDLRLAGAFEPLLRGLSGLTTWRPHVIVLGTSADDLDGLTLAVILRGIRPAHAQHRVQKETLESCGAIADGSEARNRLFP
jgi:hypothetical protein